ncbi:MAG TPA: beta-ketoacyl-[acyl-carrier-protein] synthase family protein [Cyclobacteriaceae bacterium]
MRSLIHITGLGVVSAIGNSVEETLQAFEKGTSGIGPITLFPSVHQNQLPVGEVKLTNEALASVLGLQKPVTRTTMLGMLAARQAVKDSGIKNLNSFRVGFISATTVGGMDRTENFFIDYLKDKTTGNLDDVVHHECGSTTELIADDLGIKDFISTINTACSSSVNSIILGSRLIDRDQLDVVVAGGTDALTKFTLNGFNSLMILDKEPCRPFDASRAGLNLGEGAGFVVLVSDRVLKQESLNSLAVVSGYANTNDAYHQTASSPEGRGSFAAMQQALEMSNISINDIDYINLHGTGTQNNDSSEGTAIQRLFGNAVPKVSSTKAFTGHTLGASGGIEAVFSVLAIQKGWAYPNLRFKTQIPELNYKPLQVLEKELSINHVLSNSFGFGGNCSSIVFSKG